MSRQPGFRRAAARHAAARPSHASFFNLNLPQFNLTPIAALVAGLTLASASAQAADAAVPPAPAASEPSAAPSVAPAASAAASAPATAAPAAAAASAPAAEEPRALDTVVVRSRNRIERLQDVPLSVSVVQGNELERLNATDINAITRRAANVSWNQGNQRTSSIAIRGIGKVGQTEAQDPSVGTIVDGVNYAYNALTSSFDFTDVDTVEVTRGPQGTLLGKNTSMGVINVTTKRPSFTPSADYSMGFNQRGGVQGTLAAGGPLIEDLLAWRTSFSVNRQKGDFVNAYNRDVTYGNVDRVSGRVQFLLTPSQDFNARLAIDSQPRAGEATNGRTVNTPTPGRYSNGSVNSASAENGTRLQRRWFTQNTGYSLSDFYFGGADGTSTNNDSARPLVTGSNGAALEMNWKLAGGHTLTSITAYKDYHFNAYNDEGTPFDISRNSGGFWNDYKQMSQELRISSETGGFVDYQGGLYFIRVHNTAEYQKGWGNDAGAWFANATQYNALDADAAGRTLLTNSLANLTMSYNSPAGVQDIRNKSTAGFVQANWHLSEPLTLTTGLRLTQENRRNRAGSGIKSNGNAPELNPVSVGGFASAETTRAPSGSDPGVKAGELLAGNSAAQLALADLVASRYYGVAPTGTPGAAYNSLTDAQRQQVAYAKSIRQSQMGVMFDSKEAEPFDKLQHSFVVSPSYKVNDKLTTYFSWQYGEKAGISQIILGQSSLVRPEKTNSLELGFKSALFDKSLIFNADVFYTTIKDYQQSVRLVDPILSAQNGRTEYITATGNAPEVEVKGLEVDGVYAGIRSWVFRFSGAYNRATYKSFPRSAQPVENGYSGAAPFRDATGMVLAGAPKYSFNVGADYRTPIWRDKEFHTSANVAATSGYYSDIALSSYSWIKKNVTVDWAIGVGNRNKSFDVSLIVKNLLNDDTPQSQTWNSYVPAVPRTVGILFSGKL